MDNERNTSQFRRTLLVSRREERSLRRGPHNHPRKSRRVKLAETRSSAKKAKNTIKFFQVVSYAFFAVAAVLFAIALNLFDTDFGVMGLELSGCGTILRAVSRSIYLESG